MTTYKELFGKYVQNYSSDPTSTDAEGQIWYNSTSGTFKTALGSFAVWSAGGNLNTARQGMMGSSSGTLTASLTAAGITTVNLSASESYNGTSWTNTTSMTTARDGLGGAGTQTVGLAFGGQPPSSGLNATEEFTGAFLSVKKVTTS
jgi:hypothetical protein